MRRIAVVLVVLIVALVITALVTLGSATRREQVEHILYGEENTVREPRGEWVRSVPGPRAVVWAVGDSEVSGDALALARTIERDRPDRLLYMGDVYPIGTADSFNAWGRVWGRFGRSTAPTPGNHDWAEADEGYDPYWRRVTGVDPPTFYAFTAGGWDVLSVNSEAPHGDGSLQERWLAERVTARRGTCRLVFWHRPRFSAGPRGDTPALDPLWRHLRGHARLLLSGHEHNLQQLRAPGGLTQFVVGAGGRGHQDVSRDDPRIEFVDTRHTGALRIELRAGRARWSWVAADGQRLGGGGTRCLPLAAPSDG